MPVLYVIVPVRARKMRGLWQNKKNAIALQDRVWLSIINLTKTIKGTINQFKEKRESMDETTMNGTEVQEQQALPPYLQKKEKKHTKLGDAFHALWPVLVFLGVQTMAGALGGVYAGFVMARKIVNEGTFDSYDINQIVLEATTAIAMPVLLISSLVSIPLFFYLFKDDEKKRTEGEILKKHAVTPLTLASTFGVFFGLTMVSSVVVSFIPTGAALNTLNSIITDSNRVLSFLAVAILGPISEELLFRGIVYRRLRDCFGIKAAIVGSAVVFGLVHMNGVQTINAMFLGLAFAICYEHTGSLWYSISMHIINNGLTCIVMYNNMLTEQGTILPVAVDAIVGPILLIPCIWLLLKKDSKVNQY